jgi:predicted AlkP superfamily phosphohydrolase/phosphomutase
MPRRGRRRLSKLHSTRIGGIAVSKTLFIGMDGATFTVLDHLTADSARGVAMPCLKRLIEQGVCASLRSTCPPLTPPAWVSLMTGRTPGHHGVFDFLRAEESGTEVYFTLYDSRDVRTEMIWSIASRQQRTVAALNFPITAPPRPSAGSLSTNSQWPKIVPGFVPWKHLRRNVAPRELFDQLKGLEGFDPKGLAWDFELESKAMDVLDPGELERWVNYHLPREEQWFRIAEKILEEDDPDLMAVMFDGTDKIQHQAWAFVVPDPSPVRPNSAWEQRMRNICRQYFSNLDRFISRLVALAGPAAQVFFCSDHGFTGSNEVVRINSFLHDSGYLAWRQDDGSAAGRRRRRSWFADLDWTKTLAYCRTPSSNGITIRVADDPRDPGVPPHQYEAFRERLIADLRDLRDAERRPVIAEIHKREDVFAGPAMKGAPDLTLVLRDFGFVSIANAYPVVEERPSVIGTHHPDGIFIATGPGIAAGREIDRRKIADVGATLLYSLGLPVPGDFEGEVPVEAFTPGYLKENPIRRGAPTHAAPAPTAQAEDIAEAEKAKIIEQLRSLGYMEEGA